MQSMNVFDFRYDKKALEGVVISWRLALSKPPVHALVRAHPYAIHWLMEMLGGDLLPDTFSCKVYWGHKNKDLFLVVDGIRVDIDPTIPLQEDGTSELVPSGEVVPSWTPTMCGKE